VGGNRPQGFAERAEGLAQRSGHQPAQAAQEVTAGDELVEWRQETERFESREGPRKIRADDPIGGIVQKRVVVVFLHELAFHELEMGVRTYAMAGPDGHAIPQDQVRGRIRRQ